MKLLILSLMVALGAADVSHVVGAQNSDRDAQILEQSLDVAPGGAYQYSYETSNGIVAQAHGQLDNPQAENAALQTQGQVRYTAPNGEVIEYSYIADENGFQPQGAHLPTPPPIPEAIARALDYVRAHPPAPEKK